MADHTEDYRRVTQPSAALASELACLNRIPIAATYRRINGNVGPYGLFSWSQTSFSLFLVALDD